MTKQLTTQNATITTAAIQVQAMTIGARQVTLSVFRQLLEEPLIADDGTLNGVPWGTVNYHPDKCGDHRREHWHIVWQRGQELRRARVDQTPRFDPDGDLRRVPEVFETEAADRLLASSVLEWLTGRRAECPLRRGSQHAIKYDEQINYRTEHDFSVPALASSTAMDAANKSLEAAAAFRWLEDAKKPSPYEGTPLARNEESIARDLQARQERLAKARDVVDVATTALISELRGGPTHQQYLAEFREACQSEAERRQRHRDARVVLAELPQLFIAV